MELYISCLFIGSQFEMDSKFSPVNDLKFEFCSRIISPVTNSY